MENYLYLKEIFKGIGSLVAATLVISILFIFFFVKFKDSLSFEAKHQLKSIGVSFLFLLLLVILRMIVPWSFSETNNQLYMLLTSGLVVQLFLPVQIYLMQKVHSYLATLKSVLSLNFTVLATNILLLFFALNLDNTIIIALRHLIQTAAIAVIIYHLTAIYRIFKETNTNGTKEHFIFLTDIMIFSLISAVILVMFGSMYIGISVFKAEALKLLLLAVNLALLVKILYYSAAKSEDGELNFSRAKQFDLQDLKKTNNRFEELKERLLTYFETEKPYLDSKLNIKQVSVYLYSNKTYLSRMINENFDSNFSQFVNQHRVEEAKRLFADDTKLSIQQLCDLSGFGSTATFTMAFRIFTGKTPADWCREYKIKSKNGGDKENI